MFAEPQPQSTLPSAVGTNSQQYCALGKRQLKSNVGKAGSSAAVTSWAAQTQTAGPAAPGRTAAASAPATWGEHAAAHEMGRQTAGAAEQQWCHRMHRQELMPFLTPQCLEYKPNPAAAPGTG